MLRRVLTNCPLFGGGTRCLGSAEALSTSMRSAHACRAVRDVVRVRVRRSWPCVRVLRACDALEFALAGLRRPGRHAR
eukprot:scaffold3759_cov119-Isochrysis_galbana.AAC.2